MYNMWNMWNMDRFYNFMGKFRKTGFTLVEIIIVIIILGILLTMSLTYYQSVVNQQRDKEAIVNLKLIAVAEKDKKLETGSFVRCNCNSDTDCNNPPDPPIYAGCNTVLHLNLTTKNWSYIVGETTLEGVSHFLAVAFPKFIGPGGSSNPLFYCYVLTDTDPDGEPDRWTTEP